MNNKAHFLLSGDGPCPKGVRAKALPGQRVRIVGLEASKKYGDFGVVKWVNWSEIDKDPCDHRDETYPYGLVSLPLLGPDYADCVRFFGGSEIEVGTQQPAAPTARPKSVATPARGTTRSQPRAPRANTPARSSVRSRGR